MFLLFSACGIEEYVYLPPVPESSVVQLSPMSGARVTLPQNSSLYFSNFTIFYRIYISATSYQSLSYNEYAGLNAALASDYSAFLPYTNTANTTVNANVVGTLFRNRNYRSLEIEGGGIGGILGDGGQTVTLDFQYVLGRAPTLNAGNEYALFRSDGEGAFQPVPDRYFLNTVDLNSTENATTLINADVAPASGSPSDRYAYVAMYIAATGTDNNFSSIYSAPTFLGVFRLPD
jgi:hypothetical protein